MNRFFRLHDCILSVEKIVMVSRQLTNVQVFLLDDKSATFTHDTLIDAEKTMQFLLENIQPK